MESDPAVIRAGAVQNHKAKAKQNPYRHQQRPIYFFLFFLPHPRHTRRSLFFSLCGIVPDMTFLQCSYVLLKQLTALLVALKLIPACAGQGKKNRIPCICLVVADLYGFF